MYSIKQNEWDKIPDDYKGEWKNYHNDHPEWIGKKVVMSYFITHDANEPGSLLIEGVHFIIEK